MSGENRSDKNDASHGSGKPKSTQNHPKMYWPFRWLQYLVRFAQRDDAQRTQCRNYHDRANGDLLKSLRLTDRVWQRFMRRYAVLAIGFVVAVACYLLYLTGVIANENGKLDPNWMIVIFTIVMAFTTFQQWQAIGVANSEMAKQNDIMQLQIDQMAAQGLQTDKMIAHMRLEQRAWICASAPTIEPIQADTPFRWPVRIKNTGHTPGTVRHVAVEVIPGTWNRDLIEKFEALEVRAVKHRRQTVLAPGEELLVDDVSDYSFCHESVQQFFRNEAPLFLVGVFFYEDIWKNIRVTRCCYFYDYHSKQLGIYGEKNYNYMD